MRVQCTNFSLGLLFLFACTRNGQPDQGDSPGPSAPQRDDDFDTDDNDDPQVDEGPPGQVQDGPALNLPAKVDRPSEDYAFVQLHFQVPGAPGAFVDWRYVGGLRGNIMQIDHGTSISKPGGSLERQGSSLVGQFVHQRERTPSNQAATVAVQATITDNGDITGKATINGVTGTVSGRLTTREEMLRNQTVTAAASWPSFLGPVNGGTSAVPSGLPLIENAEQIRLVWRSEDIQIGQGPGSLTRHMFSWKDASAMRTGSGAASPVLADGHVCLSYFVPTPTLPEPRQRQFDPGYKPFEQAIVVMAEGAGLRPEELTTTALEKIWEGVDDVVVCMDAATGQTLWRAVMPTHGYNLQHHKSGPFNMTPAIDDGKLFAMGMGGNLYAFSLADGKPLWKRSIGGERSGLKTSLRAHDGVVVAAAGGKWRGYDATTGEPRWVSPIATSNAAVAAWQNGGQHYLLGSGGGSLDKSLGEQIIAVEAKTGNEVWRVALSEKAAIVHSSGRGSGPGGITVHGDTMVAYVAEDTGNPDMPSIGTVAWRLSPTGARELWRKPHDGRNNSEHVPVVFHSRFVVTGDLRVIELETGNVISQGQGIRPENGGYMQGMDDLLLVRRDGSHGHIEITFYRIGSDGTIANLNPTKRWSPSVGGSTTSYHHPIMYPLADGRMFLRQNNGVYAWDLRRP